MQRQFTVRMDRNEEYQTFEVHLGGLIMGHLDKQKALQKEQAEELTTVKRQLSYQMQTRNRKIRK